MKMTDLIETFSRVKKRPITQSEIAKALVTNEANISNKKARKSEVTVSELLMCCQYFQVPIEALIKDEDKIRDVKEIVYYENEKLHDLIRHPEVSSVWKDRQVLYKKWKKHEENLRAISMFGDSMDGGARPIKNGDMLIIDTTETNTLSSGIYVYTTKRKDKLYVAYIKENMDEVVFSFSNPLCKEISRTSEELKELGFEIIGRVIHNDSEVW